jgi:hypothetical protein
MERLAGIIALSIAMGMVTPASATQLSATALAQRQLAGCMNKQMAASKTLSYNQASKICKELLKHSGDNLTASDAPKAAGVR